MSTDTRNFLAALLDHWPVTIFLPVIVLMLVGFIVTTILWDRHDHRAAAEAAAQAPAPAPAPARVPVPAAAGPGRPDGNPTARTDAFPANNGSRHRA
jgi:hypothetical protein